MGVCCGSRAEENKVDVSDINENYRKAWSLGNIQMKSQTSAKPELKAAIQAHYVKKGADEEYCKECDKQRDEAFVTCDVDNNGRLDLDEWKQFCILQCQNVSKRIGVTMIPNSIETQEA